MNIFLGLFCGILFGTGLAASGMTDTAKVLGFLDLFGNWDPSLAFVMGGALALTITGFHFILRKDKPLFDSQFHLPISKSIDVKLILGAIIFSLGWGIYGYCPGPALSALVYLQPETAVFVVSMPLGMWLAQKLQQG